jgi:hypothetical protein
MSMDLTAYYPNTLAWIIREGWDVPTFYKHPAHDTLHRLLDLSPRDEEGATTVAELILDGEIAFPDLPTWLTLCKVHVWREDHPSEKRHKVAYRRLKRLLAAHGA